jgi:hypothetical protein
MHMPFHALWVEDAILICHNAPALSVATRVCSFIKAAAISASSALLMVLLMLVHPGFIVVILLN